MKTVGLIIAKGNSSRLKNKNRRDFKGKPMFQWNLEKCLRIFKKVYVSSDSDFILEIALQLGATPIKRPLELCGDVPNIPVYQHALGEMMIKPDIIVAVQANSPTIKQHLIQWTKDLMEEHHFSELMTCHQDFTIYGSIWAIQTWFLEHYEDPYSPKPEVLLTDPSKDIHTLADFNKALQIKHI